MEQTTTPRPSRQAKPKEESALADRVAELRGRAQQEPDSVREETWTWFKELGKARDEESLNELFSLGEAPQRLDGPTDGILVVPLIQGVLDQGLSLITSIWMPWSGKRFEAAKNRGDNLLAGSAHWPAKLLWPRYSTKEVEGEEGRAAFEFETRVEAGKHDPETDVLVIDYAPVSENPDLLIRKIRDELVEIAAGAHLGKILYRTGEDSYRNLGFFALRPPE